MENTVENWQSEDQLQAACFKWFDNTYPEYRGTLFAVPNGGKREMKYIKNVGMVPVEANRFKATGVIAGVSDMVWVLPVNVEFLEFKLPGKVQQQSQIEFMNRVRRLGHDYIILYSLWNFQQYVKFKIKYYYGKG